MPPRKSNVSQATVTGDEGTPSKERDGVNIEDLSLPRTMIQRLAKGVLPPNTQIQKDAMTAISKAATVFVSYLSQAANTSTLPTTRKTISPDAVLDALTDLEFSSFLPRVQAELQKFNQVQTGKRNEYRRKLKEKESQPGDTPRPNGTAPVAGGGSGGVEDEEQGGIDGSEERAKKRARREGAGGVVSPSARAQQTEMEEGDILVGEAGDEDGGDEEDGDAGSGSEGSEDEEGEGDGEGEGEEQDSADLEEGEGGSGSGSGSGSGDSEVEDEESD